LSPENVKIIRNIFADLRNRLKINTFANREKKSGTFRGEKYRFSMRKVPLFHPKSGTFLNGACRM